MAGGRGPGGSGAGGTGAGDQGKAAAILRQNSHLQWGYLSFLFLFSLGAFWLLSRYLLRGDWPWFFVVVWAVLVTGIEAWTQHRRVTKVQHVRDAEPRLVKVLGIDRRQVTLQGPGGPVRCPVNSTYGIKPGQQVWAAPAAVPGEHVVIVRPAVRSGTTDLVTPEGPAEPATR